MVTACRRLSCSCIPALALLAAFIAALSTPLPCHAATGIAVTPNSTYSVTGSDDLQQLKYLAGGVGWEVPFDATTAAEAQLGIQTIHCINTDAVNGVFDASGNFTVQNDGRLDETLALCSALNARPYVVFCIGLPAAICVQAADIPAGPDQAALQKIVTAAPNTYGPTDWTKFEAYCEGFWQYVMITKGFTNAEFEIGGEPSLGGGLFPYPPKPVTAGGEVSYDAYFAVYQHVAAAAQDFETKHPGLTVRIGGPGGAGVDSFVDGVNWISRFLHDCSAQHVRLDDFNIHYYGNVSSLNNEYTTIYKSFADLINFTQAQINTDFPAGLPIYITEWGPSYVTLNTDPAASNANNVGGAWAADFLETMLRLKVKKALFLCTADLAASQAGGKADDNTDIWGWPALFLSGASFGTATAYPKPIEHIFDFASKMVGHRVLATPTGDKTVNCIVSADPTAQKITMLVWNYGAYLPEGALFQEKAVSETTQVSVANASSFFHANNVYVQNYQLNVSTDNIWAMLTHGIAPTVANTSVATTGPTSIPLASGVAQFPVVMPPSSVSLVVITANNTAPPPVTTLTAQDTPNDNGGSITLDWAGYTPPWDLASFKVYRSTSSFTDVTSMTPLTTLTNVTASSYVDNSTADGVNYWYAVTGVDTLGNENKSVTPAGPVESFPNLALTFPRDSSGLAMISLPLEPVNNDIGVILNATKLGLHIARYDPNSQAYVDYAVDPGAPLLRQMLGRGFWVQSAAPLSVNLGGVPAPPGNASVDFSAGWNMLGDPYTADVTLGTATVTVMGTAESLDMANQNGHTANYAWYYNTTTRGYKLISSHIPGAATTVGRGLGMWFFANLAGELSLVRPVGALQVSPPVAIPTPTADNWMLRLVARTAGGMDTDNLAGVSPQAASFNGVLKPPPLAGGVNLSFGPGGSATPTATSFVTPAAQNPTWDLGVTAAAPGTVVTVAWPDLTTVPNSLRPVLTDLATGASLYMRTTPAYQFTSGTQPRRFRLSLATGAGVTLTSVTALATAGGGAQITYALAAPAQVSADILNLGGALIRTVSTGTLSPAGISTLVWDGRNAAGSAVPAGMYLVRLTVASDSGERTTALRSLSVSR